MSTAATAGSVQRLWLAGLFSYLCNLTTRQRLWLAGVVTCLAIMLAARFAGEYVGLGPGMVLIIMGVSFALFWLCVDEFVLADPEVMQHRAGQAIRSIRPPASCERRWL